MYLDGLHSDMNDARNTINFRVKLKYSNYKFLFLIVMSSELFIILNVKYLLTHLGKTILLSLPLNISMCKHMLQILILQNQVLPLAQTIEKMVSAPKNLNSHQQQS